MTVVIVVSAVNISAFAGMASSPSSKGRALQPHRQSDKTSTIADHDDFFKTLSPFCVLIIKKPRPPQKSRFVMQYVLRC